MGKLDEKIIDKEILNSVIDESRENIEDAVSNILLLENDPEDRYQTADAVKDDLLEILRGAHLSESQKGRVFKGISSLQEKYSLLDILQEDRFGAVYLFEKKDFSEKKLEILGSLNDILETDEIDLVILNIAPLSLEMKILEKKKVTSAKSPESHLWIQFCKGAIRWLKQKEWKKIQWGMFMFRQTPFMVLRRPEP